MSKSLTTTDDLKQLGTILSIWAHPDDESYSCAGVMCAAIKNGQKVICVTATKGEQGIQDEERWPASQLAEIREHEMQTALKIAGIQYHHWLGYPDGGCDTVDEQEAVQRLIGFIEQYQPDSILSFGPEGMTGHLDHQATSRWALEAARKSKRDIHVYQAVQLREDYERMREADERFNIFFNIDKPPLVEPEKCAILFKLPTEYRDQKFAILEAMPSQTEGMFKHFGKDFICQMIATESFIQAI